MAYSSLTLLLLVFAGLLVVNAQAYASPKSKKCDSVNRGYQCDPSISHFWGQYSPYFSVPSEISADVPHGCSISFVQILSRHGARDPTASKTAQYNETVNEIHANVTSFKGAYAFLKTFEYTLGADQLSVFGQQAMINSGIKFYDRYKHLAEHVDPFVRTSGQERVVESAVNWTQGFYDAKGEKGHDLTPSVIIPEADGVNNTLNHVLCTAFEDGADSNIGDNAQGIWADIFVPPIQERLNKALPGANLTIDQTIDIMDLCPFETVANTQGKISEFCGLFSEDEWHQYGYYQTLGKYYGYGPGNPLGPTQGVGFVNELIARLTNSPINIQGSINATLDTNPATFPVDKKHKLFADFSHDNDMTGIFSALGLYNATRPLSNTTIETAQQAYGYSASWTVPFGARAYFEKLQCHAEKEELVRVIVNDRVQPLKQCGGDKLGRCTLDAFVKSLSFAKEGGHWASCFS
ncbi:acid phosphatase [Rhizodiscina lignyota]|uniref:Phytase A n=1 Tax=Rhizodiscina lignyota TaxID=1504668 RepID=A0A9P4MG21_9PEZI|nr:acid phosphatase [Rhizodiscina lignyota]